MIVILTCSFYVSLTLKFYRCLISFNTMLKQSHSTAWQFYKCAFNMYQKRWKRKISQSSPNFFIHSLTNFHEIRLAAPSLYNAIAQNQSISKIPQANIREAIEFIKPAETINNWETEFRVNWTRWSIFEWKWLNLLQVSLEITTLLYNGRRLVILTRILEQKIYIMKVIRCNDITYKFSL